ncbi:MAG: hypothetical protein JXQ93_01685 [Flavobacteriaceae bacterium]
MKKRRVLTIILVVAFAFVAKGQVVPPPIPPPPPPGLPIDSGAVFLLLSGIFYGIIRVSKKDS